MDTPIMLIKDPLCNNLVTIRKTIQINEIKIYDKKREKIKGSISLDNFFRDLHEDAVWNDENNTPFRAIDYDEYDEFALRKIWIFYQSKKQLNFRNVSRVL